MSLINQMLRDLESRQKTTTSTEPALHPNVYVAQTRSLTRPLLRWGLFAAIVFISAYSAYQYLRNTEVVPQNTLTDANKTIPAINASTERIVPPRENVTHSSTSNLSNTNHPATDKPATETKVQTGPQTAKNYAATPPAGKVTTTAPIPSPAEEHKSQNLAKPAPKTEIATAKPINKNYASTKPLSDKVIIAKQQAELLYRQAENSSAPSSTITAKLEQALKLDRKHLKARLLLIKLLYHQKQIDKAEEIINQGLTLFPENLLFISTRAQLYLQQKKPRKALTTLQQYHSANNANETYFSLLAACYQQLGAFVDAAKIYRQLLNINSDKAEYWLGLALAEEKMGKNRSAAEAYRQVLNKNLTNDSVINFVKQRLAYLN